MKAYAVTECALEYNDEYYYNPENNPGIPIVVYRSKEKAEQRVQEETDKLLAQDWNTIRDYAEGSCGFQFYSDEVPDSLAIKTPEGFPNFASWVESWEDDSDWSQFTPEEKRQLWKAITNVPTFYRIDEVEVEDE